MRRCSWWTLLLAAGALGAAACRTPAAVRADKALAAAQPTEAQLCWKPLSAGLGEQDPSIFLDSLMLAPSGAGQLWMGWSTGHLHVARWGGRGWESLPSPPGETGFGVGVRPLLFASPGDAPVLAWSAPDAASRSSIHVARWNGSGWTQLGEPLSAQPEPFHQTGTVGMVLDQSGSPLVAWFEEGDEPEEGAERAAPRFHTARWTGSAWERSDGPPALTSSAGAPTLALDAGGTPWLAWVDGPAPLTFLRVARWDGTGWRDAGDTASGHLRRRQAAHSPRLATAPDGSVLLVWAETDPLYEHASVELARWTGRAWEAMAEPLAVPGGRHRPVDARLAILSDGSPLLAWEEADASGMTSVHAQQLTPQGWRWILRGMQQDVGQSDVSEVALAAAADGGFYLAWDEAGADHGRVRVIRAQPCAPDEQPVAPPASPSLDSFWPKTVDEAADKLVSGLDDEAKATVRATPRDQLFRFHLGWGMGIRNAFGLWRGNSRLLESCGVPHPDDCSGIIIRRVWERLNERR